MTSPDHRHHIQLDGPFGPRPQTNTVAAFQVHGPTRRNLRLLALLSLPMLAALVSPVSRADPGWAWPLAAVGGVGGVILSSCSRRKTLKNMDWAIASVLTGMMISAPDNRPLEFTLAAMGGLICGLIVSRPRAAYFPARPGLIPWLALTVTTIATGVFYSAAGLAQPALIFGHFNWPVLCALIAAGFCFAGGRTSARYWLVPWLTALAAGIPAYIGMTGDVSFDKIQFIYRAAALTLPVFFISPQIARSRLELMAYEIVLISSLFGLPQFPAWSFDPVLLLSGLIFLPRWIVDRRRLRFAPITTRIPAGPPPFSGRISFLKCGHGGTAPHLAKWRGLPSCRLADNHDAGQLLCPYGCLGLGDCRRVCPAGAISLDNNFPVIDPKLCRGCGRCRSVCPKHLFELNRVETRSFIPCASLSGLKNNVKYCEKSCLGCGKCRKACPAKAIGRSGDSGSMIVDQAACRAYGEACGQVCRQVCPRKIISMPLKNR